MNLADQVICLRRDDGVAAHFCAVSGVAPDIIEASEGKDGLVFQGEVVGLTRFALFVPLIKTGCRHETSLEAEGLPIRGLALNAFRPGINRPVFGLVIFGKGGNQSPEHPLELVGAVPGDDRIHLSGRDVESWLVVRQEIRGSEAGSDLARVSG